MPKNSLSLMCWQGYESHAMTEPFIRRHNIKIEAETLLSDAATARSLINGELPNLDVLNINNAYIRDCLHALGLIKTLEHDRFAHYLESIHPIYSQLLPWSYDFDGALIGIGQRFGPFNLVINTHSISKASAQDQGFNLANDPANTKRFGILNYPDFNVFHICIGAALNPFSDLSDNDIDDFTNIANDWCGRAKLIEDDHQVLNKALVDGDIDFYISGGIYTASPARMDGHQNIVAITPDHGPIEGSGGIMFTEITSVLSHDYESPHAESFLEYLLEPEPAARVAFTDATCNPVAQMGDSKVFNTFSKFQLNAIQWDDLEEDLDRCSHYQIPPQNTRLLGILAQAKQQTGSRM